MLLFPFLFKFWFFEAEGTEGKQKQQKRKVTLPHFRSYLCRFYYRGTQRLNDQRLDDHVGPSEGTHVVDFGSGGLLLSASPVPRRFLENTCPSRGSRHCPGGPFQVPLLREACCRHGRYTSVYYSGDADAVCTVALKGKEGEEQRGCHPTKIARALLSVRSIIILFWMAIKSENKNKNEEKRTSIMGVGYVALANERLS